MERPITIYGDGKQVRDALYVEDLVRAFENFIESELKNEVFNIGGGTKNTISLLEFIEIIERKSQKKMKIKYDSWRPSDQKVYISDISKVERILKWEPKVNVEKGIDFLFDWVKKNKEFFK